MWIRLYFTGQDHIGLIHRFFLILIILADKDIIKIQDVGLNYVINYLLRKKKKSRYRLLLANTWNIMWNFIRNVDWIQKVINVFLMSLVFEEEVGKRFLVKVHCPFKWSFWTHNQVESKSTFESALVMCMVETTKVSHWIFVMWSYNKHFPWNVMHAGYWKLKTMVRKERLILQPYLKASE